MRNLIKRYLSPLALFCLLAVTSGTSQAQPIQTGAAITGEIEAITLTTPGNVWSGGTMTVGGQVIILPANLLIDLPNDYQSLQQLYTNAPAACKTSGPGGSAETGLAKTDNCNAQAKGAQATILANRTDSGNVIAGSVGIAKANEIVNGNITYINFAQGYFRLNGTFNATQVDDGTGVMVRVNDPTGRHTVQSGLACAAGSTAVNCSPDVRFKVDPDNYTFAFATGFPPCIPRTASGQGDANCPQTNRPVPVPALSATLPYVQVITTNNPTTVPPEAADSRHFGPIELGDFVTATGSYETVQATRFLSAWSAIIGVDLTSRTLDPLTGNPDLTQPDYVMIQATDFDGPAWPASRVRANIRTTGSDHNGVQDFFTTHYDPITNASHNRIFYTTEFNKKQGPVIFTTAPTGVFNSQVRTDFFIGAKVSGQEPCIALLGLTAKTTGVPVIPGVNVASVCPTPTGDNFAENFDLYVPNSRELSIRSRRDGLTSLPVDIQGRSAQAGHYKLPIIIDYGAFDDINLSMGSFPYSFSGIPWLLDRRLSPNGCNGACEGTQQPLTPFPFENYDPRNVSPNFGNSVLGPAPLPTPDQMFKFMDAAGNLTGLIAWPPTNAPAFPIVATPGMSLFPPFADEDAAATLVGIPVIIPVLANDIAPFGTIDPTSVKLATTPPSFLTTLPSGATVQVNPSGTITYTPAAGFAGPDFFTYTVANNFGSVSPPGLVTLDVQRAPVAVNDTATTPAKTTLSIDVLANDVTGTSSINRASLQLQGAVSCGTVANNPADGVLAFTAPNAVPAGGTCSFSYVVSDMSAPKPLLSNLATVTVTITASPVPIAANDTATTATGTPVTISVLTNDTIPAPGVLNPASISVTAPTGAVAPNTNSGTAVSNANGTVTYTPPATPGTYSFNYTVANSVVPPSVSNAASVTVTVTQGHLPPVAVNDTAATTTGSAISINVIGNDTVTAPALLNPASLILSTPTGGTAAANPNGTVTYTAPTTAGTYSFTYTIADTFATPATSNSAAVTVTVTAGTAPTAVNDTATTPLGVPIPISVLANDTTVAPATLNPSTVTLTAPTGGTATVSNIGVVTYTPPALAGTYTFTYTVKDNSVPPKISNPATVTVTVTAAVTASLIVVPSQLSPSPLGTPVTFVASRIGGPINNEYRFWLNSGTGFVLAQDYSSNNSWTWSPAAIGNYDILVDVRTAGSIVVREASTTISFFQVRSSTPATGVTLTSNLASPQATGTPITFTAVATGAAGPFEYRYWVNTGAGFQLVRDYFASGTFVWTPTTAGAYDILVDVRTIGNTALREASNKIFFYQIQPAPATAVAITPSLASPQLHGTPVTFTAAGSGGTGKYEYRFWLNTGTGYAIVQDYSTLPTWTWIPALAGHYDLLVDVRSLGSTSLRDASNNVFFYQIQ
jgi:hypothetical protein